MSAFERPSPAIVAEEAARRLPRVALILLCLAYVIPGFVGRSPWKSADVAAFGVMRELAYGRADWLSLASLSVEPGAVALLPYWLGALSMRLLPFLDPALAARVPFALMLAVTLALTWYAVYYLARHRGAQPVAFAFGGEASSTDYARAMADGALLALLACLGLAQLGHETTPGLTQLALSSLMLFAGAILGSRRLAGLLAFGASTVGLVLAGAPMLAFSLGLGTAVVAGARGRAHQHRAADGLLMAALVLIVVGTGIVAGLWTPRYNPQVLVAREIAFFMRLVLWFTWPAWPLVLWTLWRWRRQLWSPHVALPLWFVLVTVIGSHVSPQPDRTLLVGLPALAALAAFALPTLERSVSALIDWFTLLFFSGCAVVIWVIWIAMQTGYPAKPAANITRLLPGFEPTFNAVALALAIAASIAWLWLVQWRVGRHRSAIWKSLALPAGGAVLCWVLLMSLWLPALDFARSYGPMAQRIAAHAMPSECVLGLGLTRAQKAGLGYHGPFILQEGVQATSCRWLLAAPQAVGSVPGGLMQREWELVETVRRPGDKNEDLLLMRRVASAAR